MHLKNMKIKLYSYFKSQEMHAKSIEGQKAQPAHEAVWGGGRGRSSAKDQGALHTAARLPEPPEEGIEAQAPCLEPGSLLLDPTARHEGRTSGCPG